MQILLPYSLIWLHIHSKPVDSSLQAAEAVTKFSRKNVQSHSCDDAFVETTLMKALNEWIDVFMFHMVTVAPSFWLLGEQCEGNIS